MSVFAGYARYYDLLYRDKDYAGEARYVMELLERHAPRPGALLELGCGTGAYTERFLQEGLAVDGLDLSPEMIDYAAARLAALPAELRERGRVMVGDARQAALGESYDAVVALFHVLSYQQSNKDLLAFLRTVSAHLAPGGVAVLDFWHGPAVLAERPAVRVKRCGDEHVGLTRIAEPVMRTSENLVEVNYELFVEDRRSGAVSRLTERHVMRYLFLPELGDFLAAAGLTPLAFHRWMEWSAPDERSWNVCMIVGR